MVLITTFRAKDKKIKFDFFPYLYDHATSYDLFIAGLLWVKEYSAKKPSSEVLSHKNEIYVKMLPICKSMLKVDFPSAFFCAKGKNFSSVRDDEF